MRRTALLSILPVAALLLAAQARTPQAAVNDLLAADRAASALAARAGMVDGLTAMMAGDVTMSIPGRGFADGVDAARTALLPLALTRFRRRHTGIRIEVRAGVLEELREMLHTGEVEQGLLWDYEWNRVDDPAKALDYADQALAPPRDQEFHLRAVCQIRHRKSGRTQ